MLVILGYIFALITAGCWTQNSIIYSYVGRQIGSPTVTHIRLWLALPIVLLVNLIFTGELIPSGISILSFIYIASSGFVGFFIADLFIFRAFVDLGPRETMVIMTLSPIFGALISWFTFAEVLSLLQIGGIMTTISGVIWVIFAENKHIHRSQVNFRGIAYALAGAFTQAVGMVLAKGGLAEGLHPVSANVVRIIAGLLGLFIFSLVRKQALRDFRKMKDKKSLILLLTAAIVGPVLGIILALYALSWAPVGIVTTLMQTSPVMLLPIDRFVLKKRIPPGAVGGTIVAIIGAAFLFILA